MCNDSHVELHFISDLINSIPEHGTYTNVLEPGMNMESHTLEPGWYEELKFTRPMHIYKEVEQNDI